MMAPMMAEMAGHGFTEVHDLLSQPWLGPLLAELEPDLVSTKDGILVYATDNEPGDETFDKNVRKLAEGADVLIYDGDCRFCTAQVLATGVEDLEHVVILDQQVEQRLHIDPRQHRVDRRGSRSEATWSRSKSTGSGRLSHPRQAAPSGPETVVRTSKASPHNGADPRRKSYRRPARTCPIRSTP